MSKFKELFDEVMNESKGFGDGDNISPKSLAKGGSTSIHNHFLNAKITEISGNKKTGKDAYITFYFTRGGKITLYANGKWDGINGKER